MKVQKISFENWEGKFKGRLTSNGTSSIKFCAERDNAAVRLHVKGQKAFDSGPFVIVRLDGRIIGETVITEEDWSCIIFTPDISSGYHDLSVEFINDLYNPELDQDRNVFLGDLDILYLK